MIEFWQHNLGKSIRNGIQMKNTEKWLLIAIQILLRYHSAAIDRPNFVDPNCDMIKPQRRRIGTGIDADWLIN